MFRTRRDRASIGGEYGEVGTLMQLTDSSKELLFHPRTPGTNNPMNETPTICLLRVLKLTAD